MESGIVPNLFSFFKNFEPQCSYKIVLVKKIVGDEPDNFVLGSSEQTELMIKLTSLRKPYIQNFTP